MAMVRRKKDTYNDLNDGKLIISGDIEVNSGPVFINRAKTINAPYSQGNVDVFRQNAGLIE